MIIKNVELKNFKTHLNSNIYFGNGITTIIGENGAGKSSIPEAICHALFKNNEGNVSDLISLGKKNMEVIVDFTSKGKEYRVICKRLPNQRQLYEIRNGIPNIISSDDKAISEKIEKIIGIEKNIFINATYIRQGEIDKILNYKSGERKELISQILGIEKLEEIWKIIGRQGGIIEKYKEDMIGKEAEIKQKNEVQIKLEKNRRDLSDSEIEIKNLMPCVEKSEILGELKDRKNDLGLIQEKIKNNEKSISDIKKWKETLKLHENDHNEYKKIENKIEELSVEKKSVEGSDKIYKDLQKEIYGKDGYKKKVLQLEENIESTINKFCKILNIEKCSIDTLKIKKSEIFGIENKIFIDINENITTVSSNIDQLKGNKKPIKKSIEILETGKDGKCPTCGTELTGQHIHEIINNYKNIISSLDNSIELLEKQNKGLIKTKNDIESKLQEVNGINIESLEKDKINFDELNKTIAEKELELIQVKEKSDILERFEKEILDLKKQREELKEKYIIYISAEKNLLNTDEKSLLKLKDELDIKNKGIISKISEIIEKLGYEPKNVNKEVEELKASKDRYNQCLGIVKEKRESIKYYEKKLNEIEDIEKEVRKLSNFIMFLDKIRDVFSKDRIQAEIFKKYKQPIQRSAEEFFNNFGFSSSLKITDDYSIILNGITGEKKKEMISGGERIAAALSLRMGIAKTLCRGNFDLLILDEPTIYLDKYRRKEMISILKDPKAIRAIPQTIVITHDEEFDEIGNTIKVIKQNDVSIIEE